MHVERRFQSEDGLSLFFRDFNAVGAKKTPALCLPGLTRNSRDFIDLAARLSAQRRVLCPDFRGRGFSDYDPDYSNYKPPTYVGDVLRMLELEKIGKVVLIGTSLGGLMSMAIAALKPDLPLGIIINDIGPEVAPEGLARILDYVGAQPPVASWAEAVGQARETYGPWLPGLSDDEWLDMAKRGYRQDKTGAIRLDFDQKIGNAAREAGATPIDPWELFAALKPLPTLVLRGALSDLLSEEIFDRMAAAKPDLVRVTVPDRGHAPLLNEPLALAAIDAFLESLPG